jgi:parvulin-like peptidyl-prolyl isomerase
MRYPLVLFALLTMAACSSGGDRRLIQLPADGAAAVTVNGVAVPQALLESVARRHRLRLEQPAQREQALNRAIDLVLAAQAAQNEGFLARPQFQADVEAARLEGVFEASLAEFENAAPISDEMLKAEYEAQAARVGNAVYDFSQLLFAEEADALKAEDDIVAGKPFPEVFDAWRGKAKQARSFSRVRLDQVPESMAKALAGLKNGETTKVPVKTEFGWHVIHLDIANPYSPPPFEQVKEGIRHSLQAKIAQQRVQKLREQARIEYPSGATAPPPGDAAKG